MIQGNSKNRTSGDATGLPETESLDKIREILFGHESRNTQERLSKLGSDLQSRLSDLRELLDREIEGVRTLLEARNQSLGEKLEHEASHREQGDQALQQDLALKSDALTEGLSDEQRERERGQQQLTTELAKFRDAVQQQVAALQEQIESSEQRLFDELRDLREDLTERQQTLHQEALDRLDQSDKEHRSQQARLRESKVERSALSSLLRQFAEQIEGSGDDGSGQA